VVLFTETLDDAIPQNHPIRLLDGCLDAVDWTLWENRYDGHRGQPPIHPRLVAGCILYGLMRGLRTTRTLEDATTNRLDFMWFLERRTIDHSTFADFRVEFKKELKDLNRQISRIVCEGCMDTLLELVVDGTRMRANSDRHGARTAQALDRLIAACEKDQSLPCARKTGPSPCPLPQERESSSLSPS
jgi:transposase